MADPCKPLRDLVAFLNDQITKQKDALQAAEDDGRKTDPILEGLKELEAQLYNANLALRKCVAANPTPTPTPSPSSPTPPPKPKPGPCDSIRKAISDLAAREQRLRDQIAQERADGIDPSPLFFELRNLQQQMPALQAALQDCLTPAFVKPQWFEEGPGPTKVNDPSYSKAAGAIQAMACDPVDVDRVFIGAASGGIWMSNDASSAFSPTWVPLTDFLGSPCVSALAFGSFDPARNTLYAGYGVTASSRNQAGPAGPLLGVLRTTDGGTTWTDPSAGQLQGVQITRILATGLLDPQTLEEIILVGTSQGLFRGLHQV